MRNEKTYSEVIWDFQSWWRSAAQSVRDDVLRELKKTPLPPNSIPNTDSRFCVDYSTHKHESGSSCVYVIVTENHEIIYVGCGSAVRASSLSGHNKKVESIVKEKKVICFLICINCCHQIAKKIKTMLIRRSQYEGWNLCNEQKTLSARDIVTLRSNSESDLSSEYHELIAEFPEIIMTFDKLQTSCVRSFSSGDNEIKEFEYRKKPNEYRKFKAWSIDGEVKKRTEWCRLYNTSVANVYQRMSATNCSIKEALLFPKKPISGKQLNLVNWWISQGFVPGTDTNSYETFIYDRIKRTKNYKSEEV